MQKLYSNHSRGAVTEGFYEGTNRSEYVCMFRQEVKPRDVPLYTRTLTTCTALIIDDEANNKHYLGHFTSADNSEEIKNSICNNFSDFSNIKFYIMRGEDKDKLNISTLNVYDALRQLKIKPDFIKSNNEGRGSEVLIYQGRLMRPSKRDF